MRIERLNSDKIKVTLTAADLINLDIDVKQLGPNSKELHTFLFHIMETIREETGFNPYSGQVIVEAAPSCGGMSIIISRMKKGKRKISRFEFNNAISVKASVKQTVKNEIFYFNKFNDLCAALTQISEEALCESSLYRLNDTYCLVIKKENRFKSCINIMSEFSVSKSVYPLQLSYVKEHGKLIAKGPKLVTMAEKIRHLI